MRSVNLNTHISIGGIGEAETVRRARYQFEQAIAVLPQDFHPALRWIDAGGLHPRQRSAGGSADHYQRRKSQARRGAAQKVQHHDNPADDPAGGMN